MNLKVCKRVFWACVVLVNGIFISLAVWTQLQIDQEALRFQILMDYVNKAKESGSANPLSPPKELFSDKMIWVRTTNLEIAEVILVTSIMFIFALWFIHQHKKKVYKKNIEFHEKIQNYISERYDATECSEYDKWMHQKSTGKTCRIYFFALVALVLIPVGVYKEWIWTAFVIVGMYIWNIACDVKVMNRISKRYEENKKPVEALRALYCVRCEGQMAPYFVNGTSFAFPSYLCADGAYKDSIALTDYIWEKIKEKKRKGKAAISYYYLKYKNMKMLGLDGASAGNCL